MGRGRWVAESMIGLQYRLATAEDIVLLARMNRQLIEDEGHRNRMTLPELEERLRQWLANEYTAVIFEQGTTPVAYALFRPEAASIYLRQFFVERQYRRQGIGRQAMQLLLTDIWPVDRRITLEVLVHNQRGQAFWHALGFQDYAITLEMLREGNE
jgi:ribosomal protein S18 acetylase RimI-like enzyme